jgi:hypothetical protein
VRKRPTWYSGELVKPIESSIIFPRNPAHWEEFAGKRQHELHRLRIAKMLPLAQHFGIKLDGIDLSTEAGLLRFYGWLCMKLAIRHVPGFQERKVGRWPPEVVMWTLVACEKAKLKGATHNDFKTCLEIVKGGDPSRYGGNANRPAAAAAAKQLRNRVAAMRAHLKREHKKNPAR